MLLRRMGWLFCSVVMINDLGMESDGKNISKEAPDEYYSAVPEEYMVGKILQLEFVGYTL